MIATNSQVNSSIFSLLRPTKKRFDGSVGSGNNNYQTDLGLQSIVQALDLDGRHSRFVSQVLTEFETHPQVILYRQDILEDLLQLPQLVEGLISLLPQLADLAYVGKGSFWDDSSPLVVVARRLNELENYLLCVEGLYEALGRVKDKLKAEGLTEWHKILQETRTDPEYQRLATELPKFRAQLEQSSSITLGINLDTQFRPSSATVLSVNSTRFTGKGSILDRLLGDRSHGASSLRGITGLYKADEDGTQPREAEHILFRELSQILERAVQPVLEGLQQFSKLKVGGLIGLEPEIAFYIGAVKLINKLRDEGLALCRPTIMPIAERTCQIEGIFCIDLILRHHNARGKSQNGVVTPKIVTNDVEFGSDATIFVLTGPNSGGKTTFTRAVGQALLLFQAGLYLPGRVAKLSPVDGIFTHFAAAERLDMEGGRLAEELVRLAQIFQQASRNSIILLNEPLTSTDHTSARVLCQDLLGGLKLLGARTIFVTHIQELIKDADNLQDLAPETHIVSLIAGSATGNDSVSETQAPTYRITRGNPQTLGYASELARQYGLSLSQISSILDSKKQPKL